MVNIDSEFTEIDLTSPVPGIQGEVRPRASSVGADLNKYHSACLVSYISSTTSGSVSANEVTSIPIASVDDAKSLYGPKSEGAYMCSIWFDFDNPETGSPKGEIYGIALNEPAGGTARTVDVEFSGNATGAGYWTITLDGIHNLNVGVATGDTPTEQASELVRKYEAYVVNNPLPFVETQSGGTVTFTAATKGEHYSSFGFALTRDDSDNVGTTCTITQTAAGVGTQTGELDTALTELKAFGDAAIIVVPDYGTNDIEEWKDHCNTASDADYENSQILIYGRDVDLSTAAAEVALVDADSDAWRVACGLCEGTGSSSAAMATQLAALVSSEQHLARSLNWLSLDLGLPAKADQFLKSEQSTALKNGLTPLAPESGSTVVKCVRAIMAGRKWGVLDIKKVLVGDYVRDYLLAELRNQFKRMNIASLEDVPDVSFYTTQTAVKQFIYAKMNGLWKDGYIQRPVYDRMLSDLDDGQLKITTPFSAGQHLHQIYLALQNVV